MSTVNVDDQLFQQTVAIAAAQGKTVEQFVGETLRHVVGDVVPYSSTVRRASRNGLPVMIVEDPAIRIDPAQVRSSIEEEGF